MQTSVTSSRSIRIRVLAAIGALAIGLSLVQAGAAFAAPEDPGVTVSGTVTNEVSGAGIGGISVQITKSDYSWFAHATTDASGGYAFANVLPGEYWISVSLYVFPTGPLPYGYEPPVSTTISAGTSAVVDFPLTPYASGTSVLTGSITDAQSGLPINGATISLSGLTVEYSGSTTTSSGSYSIAGLAAGRYHVSTWVSGYAYAASEVVISDASTATWDAALVPLDAIISGRITDASGNGIPDLWVWATGTQGSGSGFTDADGHYTIENIAAGDYQVLVGGPGTPWAAQQVPTTAISDSTVVVDIQLIARTTSFVSSAVFDENYNGLQYICVDLVDMGSGDVVESTETWADAVFEFREVADGTYTLHLVDCAVSRPRIFGSTYLGGGATLDEAETFTIDGPANDLRLDDIFLAGPPTGWVSLIVTDSQTGAPVTSPFTGYLEFDSTQYPISDWTETGSLQIRDLQYGEYGFYVVAPGYSGRQVDSVVIDATTSEHMIEVELAPITTGSITIAVTDSVSGAPIVGAAATYTDAGGAHPVVDSDGDGVISLADLTFGDYLVTVTASGYLSTTLASITIGSGDPDVDVAARLVAVAVDDGDSHARGQGHERHGRGHGYGHKKH